MLLIKKLNYLRRFFSFRESNVLTLAGEDKSRLLPGKKTREKRVQGEMGNQLLLLRIVDFLNILARPVPSN